MRWREEGEKIQGEVRWKSSAVSLNLPGHFSVAFITQQSGETRASQSLTEPLINHMEADPHLTDRGGESTVRGGRGRTKKWGEGDRSAWKHFIYQFLNKTVTPVPGTCCRLCFSLSPPAGAMLVFTATENPYDRQVKMGDWVIGRDFICFASALDVMWRRMSGLVLSTMRLVVWALTA